MELIRINDDKIKIMLTSEDMTYYDIQIYSLGHSGNAIREAFSKVFDDVKVQTGFETVAEKTIIQIYPARDGGCEIYVTKLLHKGDGSDMTDKFQSKAQTTPTKVTMKKWLENTIFVFDSITDTIDACRLLYRNGYSYKSSLYEDVGKYYLFLEDDSCGINILGELCKLSDFGKRIGGKITESYIHEHCNLIIQEKAVELLAQNA